MKETLLLAIMLSCSQPVPEARSQPTPTPIKSQPPVAPQLDSRPAVPSARYAGIMGVELKPASMVETVAPRESVDVMQKALASLKIVCDKSEFLSLRSHPYYRLIDAEAESFLEDARKIGWRFQPVKVWDDVSVHYARWHTQLRAVVFLYDPERLVIGICHPKPALTAKPAS